MTLVAEYATPFMGVDRSEKALPDAASSGPNGPNNDFFHDLYSHSNYSFLGVYLTHEPIPRREAKLYTETSAHNGNNWTRSWESRKQREALSQQGWGAFFIYAGYTGSESLHNARPADFNNKGKPEEYGKLHAIHIKTAISKFLINDGTLADNNGATVFLDNEGESLAGATNLKIYYNTLFEYLRRPGPGPCQAVRPGMYCRDQNGAPNASIMLDANPDLFIWLLDPRFELQKRSAGPPTVIPTERKMLPVPIETDEYIYLEPHKFAMRAYTRRDIPSRHTIVNIPVGSQQFLNYGFDKDYHIRRKPIWIANGSKEEDRPKEFSYPRMPIHAITNNLKPMEPWDLNTSFVHDPRFPHGSPRIGVSPSTGIVSRGTFVKPDRRMEVSAFEGGAVQLLTGPLIEPDAPILMPDENTLLTIDISGNIAISSRSGSQGWSPFTPILAIPPDKALRRSRAVSAIALSDKSLHIFYIARDLSIQTLLRPTPRAPWRGPISLGSSTQSLSNLAVPHTAASTRNIFLFHLWPGAVQPDGEIPQHGHLCMTNYSVSPSPSNIATSTLSKFEPVDANPSLLLGSAIVVAVPHPTVILIFGVSRTLLLSLSTYHIPTNAFTRPQSLGDVAQHKLFAHTRLATSVVTSTNPPSVQIAAVSYLGDPLILTVRATPSSVSGQPPTWVLAPSPFDSVGFPRNMVPPTTSIGEVKQIPTGALDARRWSINPYGDIAFGVDPTYNVKAEIAASGSKKPKGPEKVLMMAGTGPVNRVTVLYRRIDKPAEDWYRVPWSAADMVDEAAYAGVEGATQASGRPQTITKPGKSPGRVPSKRRKNP